jgi:hypothetical protein
MIVEDVEELLGGGERHGAAAKAREGARINKLPPELADETEPVAGVGRGALHDEDSMRTTVERLAPWSMHGRRLSVHTYSAHGWTQEKN